MGNLKRSLFLKVVFLVILCVGVLLVKAPSVDAFSTVTLQWNKNEPVKDKYKVYYGKKKNGPYDGKYALEGNSPIDVGFGKVVENGEKVEYIVHLPECLDGETYYFVVTAYNDATADHNYRESVFSNEVSNNGTEADSDKDSLFDSYETDIYGTDPSLWDTDEDGFSDGVEHKFESDPLSSWSYPIFDSVFYTTGCNPNRFVVEDNNPSGATVISVFDEDKQNYVIELSGADTLNSYRLKKPICGYKWNNTTQRVLRWDIKTNSTDFAVYVELNTTAGTRWLKYEFKNTDELGSGNYVKFGLGVEMSNGFWHSFERNLQADLDYAQPGVEILSVEGTIFRGDGRLDNVELTYPEDE